MSRRNRALPPEVEAQVADRLERALSGGLDDGFVDVSRLAAGTRSGIRRAAVRRRIAVTAAAVAAVVVPVGVLALGPAGTRADGVPADRGRLSVPGPVTPAPPTPSPRTSDPTGEAEPPSTNRPATVVPLAQVLVSNDPREVAYLVPAAANLTAKDFPIPLAQRGTSDDIWRFVPVVPGQDCGDYPPARAPIAARTWVWENGEGPDRLTVTLTVTGWAPGTVREHSMEIVANTGPCRWKEQTPIPEKVSGTPGEEGFLAGFGPRGSGVARAAARVGDLIVGVEVRDPAGIVDATTLADDLATAAVQRARSSGLVVTAAAVS